MSTTMIGEESHARSRSFECILHRDRSETKLLSNHSTARHPVPCVRDCKLRTLTISSAANVSIITRYGYDNFFLLLGLGIALGIGAYVLRSHAIAAGILACLGVAVIGFAVWFFRDPDRVVPPSALDGRHVLAPADGRVVQITPTVEQEYLGDSAIQISIFLSPLDVHVNRYPVSGIVEYVQYHPGEYLVAWHPKSSELNERSTIGVRTSHGKVVFRQITGVLARRIVFETKVGDSVSAGERFGMMKFGSRMDVLVPTTAQLTVRQGDRVRAAESVIAIMP